MLSNLRRRLGVIAAVSVLAALVPVLSSSPVSAAPATTAITTLAGLDAEATYLACPASASIPSAGFSDTTDSAVDCLKYYGIVNGTTDTTYSPADSVTRWQMALFLTRTLNVANTTLPTGADQGFTDISGKSAEIQLAINQLKQLGITTGRTATTYDPDSNVSRQEMALFIERSLSNLTAGPGGTSEADAVGTTDATITYVNGNCGAGAGAKTCNGLYNYTDIDSGSVTVEASLAIKELFTLGIHDGYGSTFNPGADMTRAAMATFLNAALDHSNLRPSGITIQASAYTNIGSHTPTLHISNRDASFDPIASTQIDVFAYPYSTVEGDTAAFSATGACDNTNVPAGESITVCKIDVTEPATDENGNYAPTGVQTDPYSTIYNGSHTWYAWSSAAGTIYDNDLHGAAANSIVVEATPALAEIRCSHDMPANAKVDNNHQHYARFGTSMTITCQATNGTAATSGAVPAALQPVQLTHSRVHTADGSLGNPNQGKTILATSTVSYTDATGAVSFTIAGPADPAATADQMTDTIVITELGSATGANGGAALVNTVGRFTDGGSDLTMAILYQDAVAATAAHTSTTLTQTASSGVGLATGVARSVTATAYDQYGAVSAGNTITFTEASDLPNNLGVICTQATPTVCTSNLAHGLTAGQVLNISAVGAANACTANGVGAAAVANQLVNVKLVTAATTFTLNHGATGTTSLACHAASTAASPLKLQVTTMPTTGNTRVTNSAGQASYSWTDTMTTSGANVVTAANGGVTKSVTFYRLATAASDIEEGDDNAALADNDIISKLKVWDGTNDEMVVCWTDAKTGTLVATMTTEVCYKYSWDANDQFQTAGSVANPVGTAATQAAWETAMATKAATAGGTYGDIANVTYAPLSTGISRFLSGA
jgi:hypothetical protein